LPWPDDNDATLRVESQWPTLGKPATPDLADPAVEAGEQLRDILKGLRKSE